MTGDLVRVTRTDPFNRLTAKRLAGALRRGGNGDLREWFFGTASSVHPFD